MQSQPIDVRQRPRYEIDQFDVRDEYRSDLSGILISEGEIESRIEGLAREISRDYQARDNVDFCAICVLKGAMRFFGALTPRLDLQGTFNEDVVRTERYHEGRTDSKKADIQWLEPENFANKDLLVVEDIIDEGYTMETVLSELRPYEPNSIAVAVLFDKIDRRETPVDVEYTGFTIPDEFVVGYGLDYDERYRNLNHLAVIDSS